MSSLFFFSLIQVRLVWELESVSAFMGREADSLPVYHKDNTERDLLACLWTVGRIQREPTQAQNM